MHLALAPATTASQAESAVLLGDGPAALAALGLVHQALAGVELLLTGREDEVHPAIATADGLVGVHPSLSLLFERPALTGRGAALLAWEFTPAYKALRAQKGAMPATLERGAITESAPTSPRCAAL